MPVSAEQMRKLLGPTKVSRDVYRQFFIKLYQTHPEKIEKLMNCRFTDNIPRRGTQRIDLGAGDDIVVHKTDPKGRPNYKDYDKYKLDEEKNIWLMINNDPGLAEKKLVWVCRKLGLSLEEAAFLLSVEGSALSSVDDGNEVGGVEDGETETMTEEMIDVILDYYPVNNTIYAAFFDNLYARHPEMIDWLMKEHPSFRENRVVNGNQRIDIGSSEEVRVYSEQPRRGRSSSTRDAGRHLIDEDRQIYLNLGDNQAAKKKKIVRVCNWLGIPVEEAEEMLKAALAEDDGSDRPGDEDIRMLKEFFGGHIIKSSHYQRFFRELYCSHPEKLASLIGKRFTDDAVNGRNNRIDLGHRDALDAQWDRQKDGNSTVRNRYAIDEANDLWLSVNLGTDAMKKKLLWVCRTLDISPEEARFYLFGEESEQSDAGSVENSAGDAADDLHGESPVEDTASPIESGNKTSDVSDESEADKNEPAVENDANSLEVEIDSALDELGKQLTESLRKGGTGLVEIASRIEELNKLKGELAGLKERISKALSN